MAVMMSAAKYLAFSVTCGDEILRPSPQDDIATQSPRRGKGEGQELARKKNNETKLSGCALNSKWRKDDSIT
jgi:hypothetical protein